MSNTTYNGWTNYETWNVKLWMDNDEGSYSYWTERAQEILDATDADDDLETRQNDAARDLADELESYHDENRPEVSGTFGDLLTHALGCVNWYEIAKSMIDDIEPTNSSDDEGDEE